MAATITTSQTASTLPQKKGDPPNFGTVKSGRALAFDGVVDSLSVSDVSGVSSFLDGESWTFACWVSFDIVNDTFFYAGDYSTYQPHIIFSQTDSCLALRADNGYYYRFGTDSLVADKWYRVVYVASSNTITAYLNGAQYGVPITTSTAGSNSSFTSTEATFPGSAMKFTGLGASYNGAADHLLKGKMSDGQVWDSAWSATDVQNDYRHPEMLAHTFSGTSLTESNLKLWLPMTEGNPESPQTTIFDGSPNFPDTNIVSNPHFETDTSGWTGSSVTIERAVPSIGAKKGTHACKVHSASGVDNVSRLQLTEIAENQVGSVFKVSAWVYVENTGTTGSGNYPYFQGIDNDGVATPATSASESGWEYLESICTMTGTSGDLFLYMGSSGSTDTARIVWWDDVQVKKLRSANNATSVFYGDDSAVNGNFGSSLAAGDANDQWVDDNNGDTSSNIDLAIVSTSGRKTSGSDDEPCLKFTLDGTAVTGYVSYRKDDYVVGKTYYTECYVNDHTNTGVNTLQLHAGAAKGDETTSGDSVSVPNVAFDGTWIKASVEFVATATTMYIKFEIVADANNDTCHIDDFIIKEVGLSTTGHVEGQETIFQPAFVGQNRMAFSTDSSPMRVEIADNAALDFGTGSFAISTWFMITGYEADGQLLFKRQAHGGGEYTGYAVSASVSASTNKARFKLYENGEDDLEVLSNSALVLNTWHHMVCVRDVNTMKMYINGSLQTATDDATGYNIDNTDGLALVGSSFDDNSSCLAETALFKSALSLADVQELYNDGVPFDLVNNSLSSSPTLTGYWRNSVLHTDGKWKDLSANSNHGTVSPAGSTVIFPEGTTSGRDINGFFLTHPNKNYLSLEGRSGSSGGVMDIPHSEVFNVGTGSFTFECWIKLTGPLSDGYYIMNKWGSDDGFAIGLFDDDFKVYLGDGSNTVNNEYFVKSDGSSKATILRNTWYHLVWVMDRSANRAKIYLNGTLEASHTSADTTAYSTVSGSIDGDSDILIGYTGSDNYFDGLIDDIRFYNRVLTDGGVSEGATAGGEIRKNYRHGSGKHKD